MVKRIFGYVNGHEVIFMPNPDGKWKAVVPSVPSGFYVVEVQAEDEAGNVSYFAKIVYTVDIEKLVFNVVFTEFASDEQISFTLVPYISEFKSEGKTCFDFSPYVISFLSEAKDCFMVTHKIIQYKCELVEANELGVLK